MINAVPISVKSTFYAVGLNYQKADAEVRGSFSLGKSAKKALLRELHKNNHRDVLVVSTCNRTEVYGFADNPFEFIKLLCAHTRGSLDEFEKVAFVHKNQTAVDHLFKVGTGLDSQILGDFEIIGQLKDAFYLSKHHHLTGPFLERLMNSVIQASKRIKTETGISTGATSVSFASVHYILNHIDKVQQKNIILFGTGKIGRNTVENLVKHTKNQQITLINRTKEKAKKTAGKFDLVVKDYENLKAEIQHSDILIVATGAQRPTITTELIEPGHPLWILDLSVPKNVSDEVEEIPNVEVVRLDELSAMTDETLAQRRRYLPEAETIIEEVKADFTNWRETRKFVPTIKALKDKLNSIKEIEIASQRKKTEDFDQEQADIIGDRIVKKMMNRFASHLRKDGSEESLALIREVFQLEDPKNHE